MNSDLNPDLCAQVLEEEQIALRQELEDSQTNSNAIEEELSETQVAEQTVGGLIFGENCHI